MSEKPLDIFFNNLHALLTGANRPTRLQLTLIVLWFLCVLVGIANIAQRRGALGSLPLSGNPQAMLAVGPGFAVGSETATHNASSPKVGAQTTSKGIVPVRLQIPSINVDAAVEAIGLTKTGSMDTPSSFQTTAWYKNGSLPGADGNAVIDGHVNNALTSAGVFQHLDALHLGDTVVVSDASGATRTFAVASEQIYSADTAPAQQIFSTAGPSELILVTCDGAWDQGRDMFNERLVIYANLVSR